MSGKTISTEPPPASAAPLDTDPGPAPSAELDALLALARRRSREGRIALFDTVRDLLIDSGDTLTERERTLMGDILRRLVGDVEASVRRDLAERLAGNPRAPHDLVVAIASDDIEVAYPLLAASAVLADADLIEIVRHRSQAHQLAIAARRTLSVDVSAALVNTGDTEVVVALLRNENARVSATMMKYLVERSRHVDALQEPLVHRRDMPKELARRLYMWVSAALRHHLATTHDIDAELLDETIDAAARDQFGDGEPVNELSSAERMVGELHATKSLNETVLLEFLKNGEMPLFEAGLAHLLDLKPRLVRRILFEPGPEALAIACRAAKFHERTFTTMVRLVRQAARRGGGDIDEMVRAAVAVYRQIRPGYALAVAQRWRRDPQYQHALNKIEAAG